jgi:hypothetical protein
MEEREESGWKLVHGNVFRPPMPLCFAVAVGTGRQLFGHRHGHFLRHRWGATLHPCHKPT